MAPPSLAWPTKSPDWSWNTPDLRGALAVRNTPWLTSLGAESTAALCHTTALVPLAGGVVTVICPPDSTTPALAVWGAPVAMSQPRRSTPAAAVYTSPPRVKAVSRNTSGSRRVSTSRLQDVMAAVVTSVISAPPA